MGRSQESFNKKEVRKRKEKKRKDKVKKKLERKDTGRSGLDSMIAYVDENGMITDTAPDLTKKSKTDASQIEVSIPKMDMTLKQCPLNQTSGFRLIKLLKLL